MKKLFLTCLIVLLVILITGNAFAFNYYAPIEPDNKLIIYGEDSMIVCKGETCEYSFSITNNDSSNHTININPYLTSFVRETITVNEITYVPHTIDNNNCVEYGLVAYDKNSDKYTACIRTQITHETVYEKVIGARLNENRARMPARYRNIDTDRFKGRVEVITTLQTTLNAGQTKYFMITFSPTTRAGEFVVTAIADGQPSIKASLDPPYEFDNIVFDLEFNDGVIPSGWTNVHEPNGLIYYNNFRADQQSNVPNQSNGWDYNNSLDINSITVSFGAKMSRSGDDGGTTYVYIGSANLSNGAIAHPDSGGASGHLPAGNGYALMCSDATNSGLWKYTAGGGWDREISTNINCTTNMYYYALRDDTNTWYFYHNGSYIGSYAEQTEGNVHTSFTSAQYFLNSGKTVAWVDDFNFTYGVQATGPDTNPFVLSVTKPTNGNYNGSTDINFSVQDVNGTLLPKMQIYYSTTAGALTNLIYSDTNLRDGVGVTCSDYDFSDSTNCGYPLWDTTLIADGNYFIDANIYNTDWNLIASSQEFTINNYDLNSNFNYSIYLDSGTIDFNSISTVTGATINDWNWSIGGLDASTDENFVYIATEYEDINACLEVGAVTTVLGLDINSFTCRTLNSGKYYGDTNFWFFDETTGLATTATIDFNGTQYTGTSFYLPSRQITNNSSTNSTYTFTITKTGYSTRTYAIDMNRYTDLNIGFMMLGDTNSSELSFQLKQPATLTPLANAWVTIRKGNLVAYRKKTDASGYITMNLHPDQNFARYDMNIVYGSNQYNWSGMNLTINVPLDISDGVTTITPYEISVEGITSFSDTNLYTNYDVLLWTDLSVDSAYQITVGDWNTADYVDVTYNIVFEGILDDYTLQPYLLSTVDADPIKFLIYNEYRNAVPNVEIYIYKNINGSNQLIASDISDVTGSTLFWLEVGEQYSITMIYDGELLYDTNNYVVTVTPVYFYFNFGTLTLLDIVTGSTKVYWTPDREFLGPSNNTVLIDVNGIDVNEVKIFLYNYIDGNLYNDKNYWAYTSTHSCNGNCQISLNVNNFGLEDTNMFWIEARVYSGISYIPFTHKYVKGFVTNLDLFTLFVNARTDFACSTDTSLPCPLTTIISFVLALLVIGGIAFKFGFASPIGMMMIGLGVLTFFMWVGWFYWVIWLLMVIALVLGSIGRTVNN